MQTSTRPIEAIAHAQQLLHASTRSGEWREMVYAEIVQLNQFIHEGEQKLVLTTEESARHQVHALVNQLISVRVDLERALLGPTVDDWNPMVLSGKPISGTARPAKTSSSNNLLVVLVVGIGTIIAVLACTLAGAMGLLGVVSVTGVPTIVEMPSGIQIPGIVQSQAPTAIVATFEPPAVLGTASITQPDPNAPPPAADASRELMGQMPSPVPVVIVPIVEQPTAVPVVEALPTEVPAQQWPATAVPEPPTPEPTADPSQSTPMP